MSKAKFIAAGCMLACMLLRPAAPGWTQGTAAYQDPIRYGDVGFQHVLTAVQATGVPTSQERGVFAGDNIRGNGSKAGYSLIHGGIVPDSEAVSVDCSLLRRNRDYYMDPVSGTLMFTQPIRASQMIRVTYHYVPEKDQQRSATGVPSMALNFGPTTSMGLTFSQSVLNSSFDLLTYGLNLKTNLGEKLNMTNMMYVSSAQASGRDALNLTGAQTKAAAPAPSTDRLLVHTSDFRTGKLGVKMNYQDVGKDFTGFTTLRQQKAAADDVLKQLEKERGIHRLGLQSDYSLGQGASTGLNWSQIGDAGGTVSRQSLSFGSSRSNITAEVRDISEGFTSFGALTAAEQQALGKESGMHRMSLLGGFKLNNDLQLNTSFANVRAGDAGLSKYGLSLAGKRFSIAANYQDIVPEFTRFADLSDADRNIMATEQGMKRYNLTTHLLASKSITIDSFLYDAKHSATGAFRHQLRNNVVFAPSHGPKLSLLADQVSTGGSGASADTAHQQFRLDHQIGLLSFNMVHDAVTSSDSNGAHNTVTTRSFHFDTDAKRKTLFTGDWKNVRQENGASEDTKLLRMAWKLSSGLDFAANRLSVRTDANTTTSQECALVGRIFLGIGLKSRFAETSVDGVAATTTREISLVPEAARDHGRFKQVKWSFAFSTVENAGMLSTQSECAHLETNVMKHQLALDYAGGVTTDGLRPVTQSVRIASDPDPKRSLHYSMFYKAIDPGSAPSLFVRRFDLDWRISSTTKLAYNYFSYNEKPGVPIEQIGGQKLLLTTPLSKTLGLVAQWETREDYSTSMRKQTLSLGFSGKVSALGALEGSFGTDRVISGDQSTTATTYKLKYDHQVDAEHFITFTGKFTNWSGPHESNPNDDDVTVQLDLRTIFG